MTEGNGFEGTREEMERAIRRLNVLEYVIMAVAFLLAFAGGGAVAFLLSSGTALPFRLTWAVISLLLLIVPAAMVFAGDRRAGRKRGGEGGPERKGGASGGGEDFTGGDS